jgi:tetratricopeptide (TPR) repeat protein
MDLARRGQHEAAVEEFRRSLALSANDPDTHFQLGRSLMEMALASGGPLREAMSEMEKALRLDPFRDYVRLQMAEAYGLKIPGHFDPDKTISLFEELIQRHPERPEIRLRFALWLKDSDVRLSRADDPNRVLQDSSWTYDVIRFHIEKAIDLVPEGSETMLQARMLLARILLDSGEYVAARAAFESLLPAFEERGANPGDLLNWIGHCLYRAEQYEKAAAAFSKAQELQPGPRHLWDIKLAYDKLGGYPEALPERYRFPLRKEAFDPASPPGLKFTDIAPRLHINRYAGAGPVAWADFDGDGQHDLLACGCDTFCNLYRAAGDTFVDATVEAKLTRLESGFGAVAADYDGDGDQDFYLARNGWSGPGANSLMRNEGNGTFVDVAAAAGVDDRGSSFNAAWFDYDRDGWLDLIVTNGVYLDGTTNQLYRNEGDGAFVNVTGAAGLTESPGFGTIGLAVGDYDDDGWPDIFYHGRGTANRLYRNNHDGTFTDVAAHAGVVGTKVQNGYIAFFADLDSDGDLDIWTGSLAPWDDVLAGYRPGYEPGPLEHVPRYFRNDGHGTFTDVSIAAGFIYPLGIMAAGVGDVDNDGYIDIYTGTGNPDMRRLEPNNFLHNRGGERFEDLTWFTALGRLGKGHGITFIDWDRDGDLEIYAELGGFFHGDFWENAFFLNEAGNRNNWLQVELKQPGTNHEAIGARVTIKAGRLNQTQQVNAGRGFGSSDPLVLHFGLGTADRVDRLEVRWPDGATQVMEAPPVNRSVLIERKTPEAPPRDS